MFKHIKTKLLVFLIPIIIVTLIYSYFVSIKIGQDIVNYEVKEKIVILDTLKKNEIEEIINEINISSHSLVATISNTYSNVEFDEYEKIANSIMESSTNIDGIAIILEPYTLSNDKPFSAIYSQKSKTGNITSNINYNKDIYNSYEKEYYSLAKKSDYISFSHIYIDDLTGEEVFVSSLPIKDVSNNFIGAVCVKVKLNTISNILKQDSIMENKVYLLDKEGMFLIHNNDYFIDKKTPAYVTRYYNIGESVIENIYKNNEGVFEYRDKNIQYNAYYSTIDTLGWKILQIVPVNRPESSLYNIKPYFLAISIIIIAFLSFLVTFFVGIVIENPILSLINEFKNISINNYTLDIPVILKYRNDEFSIIGTELLNMKTRLKNYQNSLEHAVHENLSVVEEMKLKNNLLISSENMLLETINYNSAILNAFPDLIVLLSPNGDIVESEGNDTNCFIPIQYYIGKNIIDLPISELQATELLEKIKLTLKNATMEKLELMVHYDNCTEYYDVRLSASDKETVVAIARNLSDFQEQITKINYLSNFDQLTGLYNIENLRKFANDTLDNKEFPFCIIVADLNNVKLVNSSYGLSIGDSYIVEFSKILKTLNLDERQISYFGGGSFSMLLKESNANDCNIFINAIKEECKNHYIKDIQISAAFGYYCIEDEFVTIDSAFSTAEKYLAENKKNEFSNMHRNTVNIINRTLHNKNPREQYHSERVANMVRIFAQVYGYTEKEQDEMYTAGLLHDIGKIGITENILDKPGELDKFEYLDLKRHPEIGFKILMASGDMDSVAHIIVAHHEAWDGSGYPYKLRGEEIPVKSRMLTIADAYDAMVSDRSYRKGRSQREAVEELTKCSGTQFDAELVDIFIEKVILFLN